MLFVSLLRRYSPLLLLFALSCITPYDPDIKSSQPRLVVEGVMSDQPGPQQVRLSQSASYTNGSDGIPIGIDNASVYVTDDTGERFAYFSVGGGRYQTTPDVRGEVGRQYQLHITLADGSQYISQPDLLKPVPPIDDIYWEYDASTKLISVYVDLTDSPTLGEGYYWRWEHYEYLQYCKLSEIIPSPSPTPLRTPCRSCCIPCWDIYQCYTCVNIASDQYVNGRKIKKQLITTVLYDSYAPYYLLIEQRSLSNNAYQFWNSVKVQSSSTGGPFDAAPAPIVGNIKNIADSKERVLGFFGASSVVKIPYWQLRNQIDDTPVVTLPPDCPVINGPLPPCFECMEAAGRRTGIQPPGWNR